MKGVMRRVVRLVAPNDPFVLVSPLVAIVVVYALSRADLIGGVSIVQMVAAIVSAIVLVTASKRHFPHGGSHLATFGRITLQMFGVGMPIFASGYGPVLAVGFLFVVIDEVEHGGPFEGKVALAVMSVVTLAGQVALDLGWVGFGLDVTTGQAHGIAAMAWVGTTVCGWHIVILSQAHETETAELDSEAHRFRNLLGDVAAGVVVITSEGRITFANPSVVDILGYEASELTGRSVSPLLHPDDIAEIESSLARAWSDGVRQRIELRLRSREGRWHWVEAIAVDRRDDDAVGGVLVTLRDITVQKRQAENLAHKVRHDPLTGLANREAFFERLDEVLERMARSAHGRVAVLYLDLDGFKAVNDQLGHEAGDQLLLEVGVRMAEAVRPTDLIARVGGDEFAVVADELADENEAVAIAERIIAEVAAPYTVAAGDARVATSVGIAMASPGERDPGLLVSRADAAMFSAKAAGGSRAEMAVEAPTPDPSEVLSSKTHHWMVP